MENSGERIEKFVLVDFDNLSNEQRRLGLYPILLRISKSLAKYCAIEIPHFLNFRLYGGWYLGRNLTRKAQNLIQDINLNKNQTLSIPSDNGLVFKPRFRVALAYSLGSHPHKHLFSTLRRRHGCSKLRYKVSNNFNCSNQNCLIRMIDDALSTGKCVAKDCGRDLREILFQDEQKLVDTMIVSDIIYYSCVCKKEVCLVSSDDDMWPGIISAVSLGGSVVHLKPQPEGDAYKFYAPFENSNYKQFLLEE